MFYENHQKVCFFHRHKYRFRIPFLKKLHFPNYTNDNREYIINFTLGFFKFDILTVRDVGF